MRWRGKPWVATLVAKYGLGSLDYVKRVLRIAVGLTVLLVGIAMIVLPGPAFIVIPIGLAILATEFLWARALMTRLKQHIEKLKGNNTKQK